MHPYPTLFGIRRSAIIEITLFFLILLGIDIFFLGNTRFSGVQPHPFWLIVICMAVQYGTKEALLAAIIACFSLLLGHVPEQTIDQDRYEYLLMVTALPVMWLLAAVAFGEIRQRHVRERARMVEELKESQEREENITNSYTRLKELKENLELRIAGQFRSSIEAYRAAKEMERLNTVDVVGGVQRLVVSVLNPEQFSLYLLSDQGLESNITYGWREEDGYQSLISPNSALYQQVVGRQTLLSVANAEQERILGREGVLAAPVIDTETGEVLGMLKIERTGFLDLNLSTIETFRTLCEWIGMTLVNARRYQTAKSESMVNPDHNLMSYSYFQHYSDYTTTLAKRVGFDVSMVMVKLTGADQLPDDRRRQAAMLLSDSVNDSLRSVDLAFDYQTSGVEYAIVLPATNTTGARIVMDKITRDLNERLRKNNIRGVDFSFSVTALHNTQHKIG